MEQLHMCAWAYYENLSEHEKQQVNDLFKQLSNLGGQKGVTLWEVSGFLHQQGFSKFNSEIELFMSLNKNGDGLLELDEFVTLYYICKNKRISCCGKCSKFLTGDYFTCVQCFHKADDPFNLCCDCYCSKKFKHHEDAMFLDNNTLLLKKRFYDQQELRKAATANNSAKQKLQDGKPHLTPVATDLPPTKLPPSRPAGSFTNQTTSSDDFLKKYSAAMTTITAMNSLSNFGTNVVPKWFEHSTTNNEDVQSSGALESNISNFGSVSWDAPIGTSTFGGATEQLTGNIDSGSAFWGLSDLSSLDSGSALSGLSDLISSLSDCSQM